MLRLRQIAVAAVDLAAAEQELVEALGVALCFRDPGVAVFGLHNGLFPVGDQLFEIVSPTTDGTTAGRLLERRGGDCGYMAIFQTDDLDGVERRAAEQGTRIVFEAATDGIRGLHFHPKDLPGAIVSVDQSDVWDDWPWAGHDWRDQRTDSAVAITALTVAVDDPAAAALTWARLLGDDADTQAVEHGTDLQVTGSTVRFRPIADGREGIVALDVTSTSTRAGTATGAVERVVTVCGVEIHVRPI